MLVFVSILLPDYCKYFSWARVMLIYYGMKHGNLWVNKNESTVAHVSRSNANIMLQMWQANSCNLLATFGICWHFDAVSH